MDNRGLLPHHEDRPRGKTRVPAEGRPHQGNFLTCFLALILYKYLAKKVNRGGRHFSPDEIISTLRDMNFVSVAGEGYIPTYTRTDLTNNLHGSAGFRTDTQIVSKQRMKTIISLTKKSQARKIATKSKIREAPKSPLQRYGG